MLPFSLGFSFPEFTNSDRHVQSLIGDDCRDHATPLISSQHLRELTTIAMAGNPPRSCLKIQQKSCRQARRCAVPRSPQAHFEDAPEAATRPVSCADLRAFSPLAAPNSTPSSRVEDHISARMQAVSRRRLPLSPPAYWAPPSILDIFVLADHRSLRQRIHHKQLNLKTLRIQHPLSSRLGTFHDNRSRSQAGRFCR